MLLQWPRRQQAFPVDRASRFFETVGGLLLDECDQITCPDGVQAEDGTIYIVYDYHRTPDGVILMATFREEDVRAGQRVTEKVCVRVEIDRLHDKQ